MNPAQQVDQLESYLRQDPANLPLLADAVQAAMQVGLIERARRLLDNADPAIAGASELKHMAASLYLAEHRFHDAADVLEALVAEGITPTPVLFNLGYARFRIGAYESAIDLLQPLLQQEDAPPETLTYLMRCHHHAGRPADALAAWEAAPDRFKTPQARAVASLASLDTDRMDDARRLAEASLGAGGAPAIEALVARATVAVGEDDMALANGLLDHALKALPTDGRVWSAIAVTRLGEGDVAGAEQAFVQATTFMPQHIGSWHGLAWCQLMRGDVQAARTSFETALALDRNFGETHGGLAVVAALQGRNEEARESIERAERLDRTGLSARYAQALLDGNAQDAQALKALATRMLRGRPGFDAMRLLERLTGGAPRH